jgi:hypothetical protein
LPWEASHQAGDEAEVYWIAGCREDNRDCCSCRSCRNCRRGAGRGEHDHLATNQLRRERRQSVILALSPTIFDNYILSFGVSAFLQSIAKRGQVGRISFMRGSIQEANYRHRWLSLCRERPSRRTTEKRDEFAPFHSQSHAPILSTRA